ncbi:MAG: bifunctional phosphoribosylaminoimidazolecarboxamide formyltransferase/IMP cyclohydrolase [Chitinophagaceae bacterium]
MQKKIQSALISVFYKDGLEEIAKTLHALGVTIYSTGGTQTFLENLQIPCVPVESVTTYPSILGGRVKTLHPGIFGGILGRRSNEQDVQEMQQFEIPAIDLVIVDLYPFEETLQQTNEEKLIIEKIDIGGPSMIRAAAKNFADVVVIAAKWQYTKLVNLLLQQNGTTTLEQRKELAAEAFEVVMHYDIAIHNYFSPAKQIEANINSQQQVLRYGENPHQSAYFAGALQTLFQQLNGKELSYNNLVDVDAAIQLIQEFGEEAPSTFGIIKHTNVCGIAQSNNVLNAWKLALAGDPESAFGGVLVTNKTVDVATAEAINELFFEVLIAPAFDTDALTVLKSKKNRILLALSSFKNSVTKQTKSLLNGVLVQETDNGNYSDWKEVTSRIINEQEKEDLIFANLVCKHLKSNAIALVKNKQLIGKGCGQTSRIDALRHAIEKAHQFNFDLKGAVLASDAFFPFSDCVEIAHKAGIEIFIQPGGSIRDKDSIQYCSDNNLAMIITGMRHFKH